MPQQFISSTGDIPDGYEPIYIVYCSGNGISDAMTKLNKWAQEGAIRGDGVCAVRIVPEARTIIGTTPERQGLHGQFSLTTGESFTSWTAYGTVVRKVRIPAVDL